MNIEELREYCLGLKKSTESFPFNDVTLVFKIQGKMFGLISLDREEASIALKCDPEYCITLREEFCEKIIPAPHFNKKYWNLLFTEQGLDRKLICELINHSYDLVVAGLPGKLKGELIE